MLTKSSNSKHLIFLDGVRGLAALYVVLGHLLQWCFGNYRGEHLPLWFRAANILKFGHLSVGVFIVLSGFCLMLPVARSGSDHLPRGLGEFLKRRARRILPPYYAAIVLSLLILGVAPSLRTMGVGTHEYYMYDHASMPGAIVSHLLLLHNLNPAWIYRLDGPLWSVATEWQIYFLFPLFLLPLWRRFGLVTPIVVGFLLGLATIPFGLSGACFWYSGLFAAGMAGAVISASPTTPETLKRLPWGIFAAVLMPVCFLVSFKLNPVYQPGMDLLIGLGTMCVLIYYTLQTSRSTAAPGLRLLSSPFAAGLGAFSYSLYLIHYPLIGLMHVCLYRFHLSPPKEFLVLLGAGLPAILAVTYVFHLAFERPFLNAPGQKRHAPAPQTSEVVPAEQTS